jgi:hypothetical protein
MLQIVSFKGASILNEKEIDLDVSGREDFKGNEIIVPKFAKDVSINRNKLDLEAERTPEIFAEYATQLSEVRGEKDRLDAKLRLLKSNKYLYYQLNPFKDMKTTEASIKSMVEVDPDVIETQKQLLSVQKSVDILTVAVEAISHRRSQLKNLTMLWIGGYYSLPGQSRSDDVYNDEVSDNMRAKLRKKARQFQNSEIEDDMSNKEGE